MPHPADNYQAQFVRRWGHLTRPHVRALAWLLDAPGLLDPSDPHWQGKVATLEPATAALAQWLAGLELDPAALEASLGDKAHTRLGLYAEKLMAFYYREHGRLVAHGLQVRASRNDTVGEFDFLLEAGPSAVEHIEFATKFYLLQGSSASRFDTFLGPNLADSLGKKMRKIFDKQLVLSAHPAARDLLPRPVARARALVKGWLFYPAGAQAPMAGILDAHCRGFWCAQQELGALEGDSFVVLPRLQWLAPYRTDSAEGVLDPAQLRAVVAGQFALSPAPLLIASMREHAGCLVEDERGFVVPDDWRARALSRQS